MYCVSSKLVFCVHDAFHSVTQEPSNRSLRFFHCCTIKHQYTNFQSYLDFHKMRDVPGFHSAGHICRLQTEIHKIQLLQVHIWYDFTL